MSPNAEEFNKDELEAPEWLNKDFILDVLQNTEKSKDIKIASSKISPGTGKGDHYASVMFRIVVEYCVNGENKQRSMILKTMPEYEGDKKEMLEESYIFETEIGMYTDVIPRFESILRAVGDKTVLGAQCLYYSLSPRKLIIFEDIVPLGYTVLRGRTVSFDEVKAAYSKLAKWHAISYKISKEEPEFFDKYRHGVFNNTTMIEKDLFTDGITNFIEMLGQHEDLVKYKKYFESLEKKMLSDCVDAFSEYRQNPHADAIYVLCHGDFHFKNMMFKHDPESGNLEDVMLLDFQFTYIGPIGNDLMYSFYMLLNSEQRANHFDELLYHYFKTFQDTLKKIGFKDKIPKIIKLKEELTRHKNLELFLMVTFCPMWECFIQAAIDVDELVSSAETRKKLFKNQNYVEEIRRLLPKYLYKGYLEN